MLTDLLDFYVMWFIVCFVYALGRKEKMLRDSGNSENECRPQIPNYTY